MVEKVEYIFSDSKNAEEVLRRKDSDESHIEHYERGYKVVLQSARDHLSEVLRNRRRRKPGIFKPGKVGWTEFPKGRIGYIDDDFIEENRERAEAIGIHYIGRVIDLVPVEELKIEIEIFRDHGRDIDPERYYMVELNPITPTSKFLNHDRSLFGLPYNIQSMRSLLVYIDLVAEGVLHIKEPWKVHRETQLLEDTTNLAEKGITMDRPLHFMSPEDSLTGEEILMYPNYYAQHIMRFNRGLLSFPDQSDTNFIYLKKYDINPLGDEMTSGSSEFMRVRFQIDVEELLKCRNIFADPEQLAMPDEYGYTYIVPGGIPISAIYAWDFWIDHDNKPPIMREKRI